MGEILEHPIVEYHHDRETSTHEQETTEFHAPVQVGDRAGWPGGRETVAQICRERDNTELLYYKWRDAFMERAADMFADQRGPQPNEQAEQIAALERLAGKQALEIEILKKAGSLLGPAHHLSGGDPGCLYPCGAGWALSRTIDQQLTLGALDRWSLRWQHEQKRAILSNLQPDSFQEYRRSTTADLQIYTS